MISYKGRRREEGAGGKEGELAREKKYVQDWPDFDEPRQSVVRPNQI